MKKKPPCPLCWAPMLIDPCRDGFICESPHGTRGRVFVGYDDAESGAFELPDRDPLGSAVKVPLDRRRPSR